MQNTELQIWLYGLRGEKQDDQRPERAKYSFRDLDTYILKTKKLRWTLEPGYEIKDGLSYVCNGFEVIKYIYEDIWKLCQGLQCFDTNKDIAVSCF